MCSTGNLLVHCYRNVKGAVVYLQTPVDLVKNKIVVLKCFLDTALQLVLFKGCLVGAAYCLLPGRQCLPYIDTKQRGCKCYFRFVCRA